jgi:hypothetical protein
MTNAIERSILGESEKLSDRANFTLRSRARDYAVRLKVLTVD